MRREISEKRAYDAVRRSRDGEIAAIVARQHGVIAREQLLKLGVTRDAIRRRLEAERLYPVQPRVYSLLPEVPTRGRMMAAVITCVPGAALSHRAAAAIWDLGPWPAGLIDVTVPGCRQPRRGIRLHRARVERVIHDGFPVTTVARTLVDQAAGLPLGRLRDQFEQAERLRLLDVDEVSQEIRGRRGAKNIRLILGELTRPEPARSELERIFRPFCEQHGLPVPSLNTIVHGQEVDAHWPGTTLVVELDGWEWHRTRAAFEDDRRRAAALEAAGYHVLRFTWRQLENEPELVAAAISRRLRPAGS